MKYRGFLVTVAVVLLVASAAGVYLLMFRAPEVVEDPFSPRESHATYREGLQRFMLDDTMLGSAWINAAEQALDAPVVGPLPLSKVIFFDPHTPEALALAFPVTRGRQVTISLDTEHGYYFADVFRLDDDGLIVGDLVASRPDDENRIVFEARSNGYYLFRLQPELLRGGRFTVEISESASLAFPVEGASAADIWSFFGDGRDGGARVHHGVDIFAPRGTPVVAVSDSEVIRVGQRDRGGNVVVLRDEVRGINLYYAHLDEHRATRGTRVRAGDVIGTVGNTGNALTTPPHLHIGIYQGGWRNPVDPWGFFVDPAPVDWPPPVDPDTVDRLLGVWMGVQTEANMSNQLPPATVSNQRPRNRNPILRGAGDTFAGAEAAEAAALVPPQELTLTVPQDVPLQVIGGTATHLRVRTVNGMAGMVSRDALSRIPKAERPHTIVQPTIARDLFAGDAIALIEPGSTVAILSDSESGTLVRLPGGRVALLDGLP